MIAKMLLVGAMLGQYRIPQPSYMPVPPMVPATEQFEDFPIHIRVIQSKWRFDRRTGNYIGWGFADILGPDGHGFDFTYTCDAPFLLNDMKGQFYEANWRKPQQKLDILTQQVGGKHTERCTLRTALRPGLYSQDSMGWEPPQPATAPAPLSPAAKP